MIVQVTKSLEDFLRTAYPQVNMKKEENDAFAYIESEDLTDEMYREYLIWFESSKDEYPDFESQLLSGQIVCNTGNGVAYRKDDCVCVEVPHGRLIDADELMNLIYDNDYLLESPYTKETLTGMSIEDISKMIDMCTTWAEPTSEVKNYA